MSEMSEYDEAKDETSAEADPAGDVDGSASDDPVADAEITEAAARRRIEIRGEPGGDRDAGSGEEPAEGSPALEPLEGETVAGEAPQAEESVVADGDVPHDGEAAPDPVEAPADAEARVEELEDRLLRKQAELVNYRRRVERDRAEIRELAQADLLRDLLPILDDFERAVEADASDGEAFRQGVELILRSIQSLLRRLGVERIEAESAEFDPRLHEAIARQESDGVPVGEVIEVYQPGYTFRERLLRPARVVVSAGATADDSGDAAHDVETEETEAARAGDDGSDG